MRGNSAIMKCLIPSFVADFVSTEAWIDEEGTEFTINKSKDNEGSGLDVLRNSSKSLENSFL